jgi:hypothetical protein
MSRSRAGVPGKADQTLVGDEAGARQANAEKAW